MSLTTGIHSTLIGPLTWLGKTDWITPTANGYRPSADLQGIITGSHRFGNVFADHVRHIICLSMNIKSPNDFRFARCGILSYHALLVTKALATGQKIVKLSNEWCEQFESTDLTLFFKDYRQPFPTMVIDFPSDYAEDHPLPETGDYIEFVAFHHEEKEGVIVFEIKFRNRLIAGQLTYNPDTEIEDALKTLTILTMGEAGIQTGVMDESILRFLRIALNAMIAMTYRTDWEKIGPTRHERNNRKTLKKQNRSKDRQSSSKAKLLLGTLPEYFGFKQKIKAFAESPRGGNNPPDSNGTPKKPHWRRGHWRQLMTGPERTDPRPVWIQPMLINSNQFKGDLKDTTTTYIAS